MKIIKPSVEFFGAVPTDYDGALRFIEMAGRTCYKSDDKITEDSAEGFVRKLIKAGHLAMIEHSNFVIRKPFDIYSPPDYPTEFKYLNVRLERDSVYIGGNLTAWYQCFRSNGLAPIFDPFLEEYGSLFGVDIVEGGCGQWEVCPHDEIPKELHRYSAKFICDRGVSHELVRHRPCSFAQESTRYVNYGGKDMEFIEPAGFEQWIYDASERFKESCVKSEEWYQDMVGGCRLKPQQARAVLPNALKTEIVVTADAAEWRHIKKLRTHPSAHPDMVRVMNMMPWGFLDKD